MLAVIAIVTAAAAAEEPLMQGMDVADAAKAVAKWVSPPAQGDKPWSGDLAALTGRDARALQVAMGNLIRRGAAVLPDLAVLAKDQDWLLRSRVAQVAAGIGGTDAAPLLISLTRDGEARVREIATLGLGRCEGPGVYERLAEQISAPEAAVRQAAAQAMGFLGDVRALAVLSRWSDESDDFAKRAMKESIDRVAQRPEAIPSVIRLLEDDRGPRREAMLEACARLQDPRLCPALVALVDYQASGPWSAYLATRALATNGDSRAWEALCRIAADAPQQDLRDAASESMRALTGYSGFGKAWTLWWRDHATEVPRLAERDAFIADLHDLDRPLDRTGLARFSTDELMTLVDAACGSPGSWWAARAFSALRADDPQRWMAPLAARARTTNEAMTRLAMIIFIDQLDGPTSATTLRTVRSDLEARVTAEAADAKEGKRMAPDHGAELLALKAALQRRER
ncbi:MAG: HEAT repeat domain-containing protein [Planctomycetes bacterium]|nr:HEAT repeat domain-containing protein [Planctomycetota bacterium]